MNAQRLSFVLALGVLAETVSAQVPTYAGPSAHPVGPSPFALATGDLDGDGHLDLVAANSGDGTVSVLRSLGHGRFAPQVAYAVGNGPLSVAVGDLDGDARPEIVTANDLDDTVSVLANQGDGTFVLAASLAVGSHPESVAIADLDGDGLLDVVAGNYFGASVSVLRNLGVLAFAPQQSVPVAAGPIALLALDLDQDGDVDLATANFTAGSASILRNLGGGSFAPAASYAAAQNPVGIAAGDLEGDGDVDLVLASTVATTGSILSNQGGGSFAPATPLTSTGFGVRALLLADLDGDGDVDLATSRPQGGQTGGLSVLPNQGNGTFALARAFVLGRFDVAMAAADLDEDGDVDLLAVDLSTASVVVAWNDGHGGYAGRTELPSASFARFIALGDVDGDGRSGLVVVGWGSIQTHHGVSGEFDAGVVIPTAYEPTGRTLADLDGDGVLDLAVCEDNTDAIHLYFGNGAGTFVPGPSLAAGTNPSGLAAGDLDGDGDADLVVGVPGASATAVYVNAGNGTFAPPVSTPAWSAPHWVSLADANGDGNLDLVTTGEPLQEVDLSFGNGDATFGPALRYPVGFRPYDALFGDLDGDGDLDLVVQNSYLGGTMSVSVLRNQGGGSYAPEVRYTFDGFVNGPFFADVEGDGDLDLVLSSGSLLLNDGTGTFAPEQRIFGGILPSTGIAGDLDADGDLDLVVTSQDSFVGGAPCHVEVLRDATASGSVFCAGDGSDGACPCGNFGATGHGCANSFFAAGAQLAGSGVASVVHDTVLLSATNVTGPTCVFFQGSASMPAVAIDDGLGCVTGSIVRLGTKPTSSNASAFPAASDPRVSVKGAIPSPGATRFYQAFYRNAASAFCPPAGSNRTNGYVLTWTP